MRRTKRREVTTKGLPYLDKVESLLNIVLKKLNI